jgi:hypothetical protein
MKVSIPLFFVLTDFATVLAAPFGGEFARDAAVIDITTRDAKGGNVFARQPFGGEFARETPVTIDAREPTGEFARDGKDDNVFARRSIGEFARK